MATTVRDIVTRAYRKLGIFSDSEPLTAEAFSDGLDALNSMMHAWKLQGVDLAHTDLADGADFSLPEEYVEGTVYLLARTISPDYEVPANFDANDWFKTFQAAYMKINAATFPSALTRMPSRYNRSTRNRSVST